MQEWQYRIVIGSDEAGLEVAASNGLAEGDTPFEVMVSTIRRFTELDANDDNTLGNVGRLRSRRPGFVAMARRPAG